MTNEIQQHYRHNVVVNILDGSFFGFGIGFASFVTIIPLFVSTLTDSALLIGLIPAIHGVTWQLPQLLIAGRVARQTRFKPLVVWLTLHERLPYLGLALAAWLVPISGSHIVLGLTFFLLVWQGLGGGFAANAWQSMIAKIIPSDSRGTFFGAQAAGANLLASISAIIAGIILERLPSPLDYISCFLFASVCMAVSLFFLSLTHEPSRMVSEPFSESPSSFWKGILGIIKSDRNFRWFLVMRALFAFGTMAFAFYTVYAVRHLGVTESQAGMMTGVFTGSQIVANPLLGWLSDHWSHRKVLAIGVLASIGSAIIAWWAPRPDWFYLVFILAGLGNVAMWTIGLAITLEFGSEKERPYYIGLTNTLVAPSTLLAPFIGGWLADFAGYPSTFFASIVGGGLTLIVIYAFIKETKG